MDSVFGHYHEGHVQCFWHHIVKRTVANPEQNELCSPVFLHFVLGNVQDITHQRYFMHLYFVEYSKRYVQQGSYFTWVSFACSLSKFILIAFDGLFEYHVQNMMRHYCIDNFVE